MEIVVNEWLLDYMCPNTDPEKMSIAIQFVNAVVRRCDKIVIGRATPFVSKFYHHMGSFGWDPDFKKRFSKLNQLLFYNSDKTIIIDDTSAKPVPKEIEEKTSQDDRYLIELAYSSADRVIVTTDQRLRDNLQGQFNLKIYLPDEFLSGLQSL